MATSIRDLLQTLEREAQWRITTEDQHRDAAQALAELGRALTRLADDGLERDEPGLRANIVRQLAQSCSAHAHAVRPADAVHRADPGRLTSLAGAAADTVGPLRHETGREQRWATCVAIAGTVRVLATYAADGDGHRTADLVWTHLTARALTQQASRDQPAPGSDTGLDRPIPQPTPAAGAGPARTAAESLLLISDRLRRSTTGRGRPPTLLEIFAVTRAAETTIRHATLRAGHAPTGQTGQTGLLAAATIWREIRAELRPFTSTRIIPTAEEDLTIWAHRVHTALRDQLHAAAHPAPALPGHPRGGDTVSRHLTAMLRELPPIAGLLATSLTQLADHRDLHALARKLPYRDHHLDAFLSNRAVIADRYDLTTVLQRLEQAAVLAARTTSTFELQPRPETDPQPRHTRDQARTPPTERQRETAHPADELLTSGRTDPEPGTQQEPDHDLHHTRDHPPSDVEDTRDTGETEWNIE